MGVKQRIMDCFSRMGALSEAPDGAIDLTPISPGGWLDTSHSFN